jgi:hypothetical protein
VSLNCELSIDQGFALPAEEAAFDARLLPLLHVRLYERGREEGAEEEEGEGLSLRLHVVGLSFHFNVAALEPPLPL